MNDNRNKTNFRKAFYIFSPLILYIVINSVIAIFFVSILLFKLYMQNPGMEMTEISKIATDYVLQENSKLMIVTSVLTIIFGGIMYFQKEYKAFDRKYRNNIGLKGYTAAFSLGIGFYMLLQIVFIIALSLFDINDIISEYNTGMNSLIGNDLMIDILALGIIVPVCEELIFRGLIFNRMRSIMKESNAIIFSAVVFGLLHTVDIQIFYTIILGYILAYAYSKYENILIPIIIHMIFNLMNFVSMIDGVVDFSATTTGSLIYYGVCVLFTYAGVRILIKKTKPSLKL